MLAGPFAISGGTRNFTSYPSTAPGKPTALSTSAAFPFTATSTGELTIGLADAVGNKQNCLSRLLPDPQQFLPEFAGRNLVETAEGFIDQKNVGIDRSARAIATRCCMPPESCSGY